MQAALGKALSRWQRIEGALSRVFWVAVTARHSESASAAFAAIHSAEVQIDMTDATVRMTYRRQKDVLERWKSLRKRLDKLRPKRNRLAHGTIGQQSVIGSGEVKTRFLPFFYLEHHHGWDGFEQWTLEDLEQHASDFTDLAKDLTEFWWDVKYEGTLLAKSPEPSPEPGPSQE